MNWDWFSSGWRGKVIAVLGVVIVGTAGSGLWDVVAKPILVAIASLILRVTTLGIGALIDQVYSDAARGRTDALSALTLLFVLVVMIFIGVEASRRLRQGRPRPRALPGVPDRYSLIIAITSQFFILAVATRYLYLSELTVSVEQLERIVAPFVTDQDRLLYSSKLASATTKGQYVSVINEMQEVAKKHNIEVPYIRIL